MIHCLHFINNPSDSTCLITLSSIRYERLNDPAMDPIVVKAVRAFARQKKIVTHECIIDVGEKIAAAKQRSHQEEVERKVAEAVSEIEREGDL